MPERRLVIGPQALEEIRRNADWRQVFTALGIKRDEQKSRINDWWALSPLQPETVPSFHMGEGGRWYCFSAGRGGGVIELVQEVRQVDCYEAARWLVDSGLSRFVGSGDSPVLPSGGGKVAVYGREPAEASSRENHSAKPRNEPIRQSLLPFLNKEHDELKRRGISSGTCAYLGCGHLAGGKSPLAGRIVFQVRGVVRDQDGALRPVILTHIGRALTAEQEAAGGKWHMYAGFHKSLEVYNIDRLTLDDAAGAQAAANGHVLITEGCFDVAALVEADIRNVGATFGAHLDEDQLPRLRLIAEVTGVRHFRVWYDRDPAGKAGQEKAVALINASGDLTASGFDWDISFPSPDRGSVKIPESVTDPGEFTGEQLKYLRNQGLI